MPANKHPDPIHVCIFGIYAVVQVSDALAKLVEQPRRAQRRHVTFGLFVIPVHTYSILVQEVEHMQLFGVIHSMLYDTVSCYLTLLRYKSRYVSWGLS